MIGAITHLGKDVMMSNYVLMDCCGNIGSCQVMRLYSTILGVDFFASIIFVIWLSSIISLSMLQP